LDDYYIGELREEDQSTYKSQYVHTDANKEGGPTPIIWVIGKLENDNRKIKVIIQIERN
jgi:hypothetical protein